MKHHLRTCKSCEKKHPLFKGGVDGFADGGANASDLNPVWDLADNTPAHPKLGSYICKKCTNLNK